MNNFIFIAAIKYIVLALIFIGIGQFLGYSIMTSLLMGFGAAFILCMINYYTGNTTIQSDSLSIDNT